MIESPQIVQIAPSNYASIALQIPVTEVRNVMGPTLAEVGAALEAQGIPPAGAWFTHHFKRPTMTFDFEICVPVAAPVAPAGRVLPQIWPAMTVVRTVFHGNYAGLPAAWGELEAWIKAQGLAGGTEFWEVYTINPEMEKNPEDWRTELNWPLAV